MNPIQSSKNKPLIVLLAIGVIILLAWFIVWYTSFRLSTTDPRDNATSTITQISFTFTRDLSEKTLSGIETMPATNGAYVIDKNTLIFKPSDDLQKGPLTFVFKNIIAKDSSTIPSLQKTFEIKYIEYNDLSKEEQKRQIDQSGGGQQQFDLINGYIPHAAPTFILDYIEPFTGDTKLTLVIDVYGKAPEESQAVFETRMEQAKADMLSYVEANRGKNSLDDFIFIYNNDYLSRYNTLPTVGAPGG